MFQEMLAAGSGGGGGGTVTLVDVYSAYASSGVDTKTYQLDSDKEYIYCESYNQNNYGINAIRVDHIKNGVLTNLYMGTNTSNVSFSNNTLTITSGSRQVCSCMLVQIG